MKATLPIFLLVFSFSLNAQISEHLKVMVEVKCQASKDFGQIAGLKTAHFEYDSTLGLIKSVALDIDFTISDDPKQLLELEKLINRAIEIGDKMLTGDCEGSEVTLINDVIKEGTKAIKISTFTELEKPDNNELLVNALREKQAAESRKLFDELRGASRRRAPEERREAAKESSAKQAALRRKHAKEIADQRDLLDANNQLIRRI